MSSFRLISVTLIVAASVYAPDSRGARITLEHADSLQTTQGEQGTIYEFIGRVHFTRDSSDLYADRAVWYERSDLVRLIGGVRVKEPSRALAADSLLYDQKTDIAHAWGRVVVEDTRRHVKADGGEGVFERSQESLVMTQSPKLILDYDLPRVPTVIIADTIRYLSGENLVEAIDSVMITQGSLKARAQHALIYFEAEQICLTGDVQATQRDNQLSGETMTVYSKEKQLQKIEVSGEGEAIFRELAAADTLVYNQSRLTAEKMEFFFSDDILQLINAQGNSYSYYTPAKEDTVSKGSNVASGDSTILLFANSGLSEVFVVTSAEGIYTTPVETDSAGAVTKVDTVVYSANRINYKVADKVIYMRESARVKQQQLTLDANEIRYDIKSEDVHASGFYDSAQAKYVPLTLKDRTEEMTGERLVYNLVDKRGKIKESRTKVEQAYYSSGILRKEEEGVLLARGGSYTTCENPEPHFHFSSSNMKLITDDKVIARPVVLYIESLPVLGLPYFVFSTKKGRHSGFLPLQFGNFERGQRFVNNLGYYWALSDYWDMKASINVSETAGLRFNAGARYAVRYKLSGAFSGSYSRETEFVQAQRTRATRYEFSFNHSHTLDPTLSISGSGQFLSDKRFYTDYSTDLDKRLNRQLRSQFSITKRWEGASLTAAVDQTKYLDTDAHSERMPSVRFSFPSRPAVRSPKKAADKKWYHDVYYSYNNAFLNSSGKTVVAQNAMRKKYATFSQDLGLRAPVKLVNAITVSPSFSLSDYWYYLPYSDQADSADVETKTIKNRQTWTSSISLSTNLYGTVSPDIFSIVGLRHVLSPSVGFSYRPRFTRNAEYADFTGLGGSGGESKSVTLSVQNQFQMKYLKDGKERKADLLKYSLSTGYNFVLDKRRWSDLVSSLSSPNIKNLTLEVAFTHDLYHPSSGNLRWWSPTLKTLSVSSGYRGAFRLPIGREDEKPSPVMGAATSGDKLIRFSIAERYSETRGTYSSVSHWVLFDIQFSPSKNWQVKYRQNYDIRRKQTTEKVIELYRDLHCWEGSLTWVPEGSRAGYYFRIGVKLLPDLKFEKSESGIRDMLFGLNPYQ